MRFMTLNRYFNSTSLPTLVLRGWPRGVPIKLPTETFYGLQAMAEVNHGRWIVRCPLCLDGAWFADEIDRRFFCTSCLHAGSDAEGKWLAVEWPTECAKIEQALARRALPNRNWRPGQTVEELEHENEEHGVM